MRSRSCRWAISSASSWPRPWSAVRRCSSSTSRSRVWTRSASTPSPRHSSVRRARACPWCSPATSSTSWNGSATPSGSSPAAAWSPPAPSRSYTGARPAGCCGSSSPAPLHTGPSGFPVSGSSPSGPATRSSSWPTGPTTSRSWPRPYAPAASPTSPGSNRRSSNCSARPSPFRPPMRWLRDRAREGPARQSDGGHVADGRQRGGQMTEPRDLSSASLVRLVAVREISARVRDKNFIISSVVILVVLIGLLAMQVALSSGTEETRIGVVGNPAGLEQALQAQGDALEVDVTVVHLADDAAARAAVDDEEVDGALLADGAEPELIVRQSAGGSLQAVVQGAVTQLAVAEQLADAGITSLESPEVAVTALDPDADEDGQRV